MTAHQLAPFDGPPGLPVDHLPTLVEPVLEAPCAAELEPGLTSLRPVPACLRETFKLLASYRPEEQLKGLLRHLDFSAVTPRQIYYAAHGRPPEDLDHALPMDSSAARERFYNALTSDEFRLKVIKNLLDAFPEYQRLLFIHIPRSAGSELSLRLTSRYPSITQQFLSPEWFPTEKLCAAIGDFVSQLPDADAIFVRGHIKLEDYRGWHLIRFRDRAFTVLREPVAGVMSQLNHVLTRLFTDEHPAAPDSVIWRERFGLGDAPRRPFKSEAVELARQVLRDPEVVQPNIACCYLGNGTAERAIANIVIEAVEVTDLHHYHDWCRERWGIDSRARSNASKLYVTQDDFDAADRDYLASVIEEDVRLYRRVQDRLTARGGNSIIGPDIL